MKRIEIPERFNRNHPEIAKIGPERTGSALIRLICDRIGLSGLSDKDILDVGCGCRLTQAIINCDIPIKSYTGVDVDETLIQYLDSNVQDTRFSFHYWNVYHEIYHKTGKPLTKRTKLPVKLPRKFDLIWLLSVFTHLHPRDAENLLHILRNYVKDSGYLFFSAFIGSDIASFEDRVVDQPLHMAYYSEDFMRKMLSRKNWHVLSMHEKEPNGYIQHHFVCSPAPAARGFFMRFRKSLGNS